MHNFYSYMNIYIDIDAISHLPGDFSFESNSDDFL